MCGFGGFFGFGDSSLAQAQAIALTMQDTLVNRGPDDSGIWFDERAQVILAHRRLAIQDISAAGHQPMVSASGRFVIVYNGEVYNHFALRAELENCSDNAAFLPWHGHSDTETILAGIEAWGLQATIQRAVGMFAFIVWDKQQRTLTLVRDRMGEKPLYYGWQKGIFVFGSQLQTIAVHPACEKKVNRDALALLLRHNYVPTPYSIYSGIHKLPQGTTLTISTVGAADTVQPKPYWSFVDKVHSGVEHRFTGNAHDAITMLEHHLVNAVRGQMLCDVPFGAFLSGGIDSSLVVALMQAQSSQPVKTFSIGFHEQGYNEAEYAQAVAKHLGTDHTQLYVTPKDAMDVIDSLPCIYDEPFSDSSQIPTFLVSSLAKSNVSVSLSGDGGDELFCGYNRYVQTQKWWNRINTIHPSLRKVIARLLVCCGLSRWDALGKCVALFAGNNKRWHNFGHKIDILTGVLGVEDISSLYKYFVTHWSQPDSVVINANELPTHISHAPLCMDNAIDQMMALDALTYLPDDILVKVDRAAMGVSLETRVPMLDHRVVEFAWQLPQAYKLCQGHSKWILRQILYKYVPKHLIDRPKMGFGVPIDAWLRGPLRQWAEDMLDESLLRRQGFFYPAPIRQKWQEHLSGKRNWQYHLWDILMFQAWLLHE